MNEEIEALLISKSQLNIITTDLSSFKLNIKDIYVIAILKRSISLIDGFIELIKRNNYLTAISLIRLHLDSLLRFYAPNISELSFNEFANKIIFEDIKIREINSSYKTQKDKIQKLSDSFLVKKLSELPNFSWVLKSYNSANGFVHFSYKHVFASIKASKNNNMVQFANNKIDFIPDKVKIDAIIQMITISNAIIFMTEEWIKNRNNF